MGFGLVPALLELEELELGPFPSAPSPAMDVDQSLEGSPSLPYTGCFPIAPLWVQHCTAQCPCSCLLKWGALQLRADFFPSPSLLNGIEELGAFGRPQPVGDP